MEKLNIGVIGLGVGERHVAGYQALDGVTVSAVCDIDPAKLKDVADRRAVETRHQDWRQIIEDPDIDAVSICSYDDGHAEQVIAAFEAGKHVMVEKPVALHKADLERVARAHQDSGKTLSSNLILRQSPRFKELRRMVRDGVFGDLFYLEGDYLHQILWKITEGWRGQMDFYCVTYGGGIHLIDLMRWIIGEEVTEVTGMGAKKLTRGGSYAYPDTITSLLRFDSDAMAKSTTTFGAPREKFHRLNLYGTQLSFENGFPEGVIFHGDQPEDREEFTVPYRPTAGKGDLLPDFIASIREDREPIVSHRDVYRVMDICFACWESVQNRRSVDVSYTL